MLNLDNGNKTLKLKLLREVYQVSRVYIWYPSMKYGKNMEKGLNDVTIGQILDKYKTVRSCSGFSVTNDYVDWDIYMLPKLLVTQKRAVVIRALH